MEHWLPIDDFDSYEVSDHGRVRNANTGHILNQYDNGLGTLQVTMFENGRLHARAVHRLVASAFISPPPEGAAVMFKDHDRTNLHVDNLDWKPRWFVVKRTIQHKRLYPRDHRRVLMHSTNQIFENSLVCAEAIDGLEELVILTAGDPNGRTYKGSTFSFV